MPLSPPINGDITCSNQFKANSKCKFTCHKQPAEFIFPSKVSQRKCQCSPDKGCKWTKSKLPDRECQPGPSDFVHQCQGFPTTKFHPINYTSIECDDSNRHDSLCEIVCTTGFMLVQQPSFEKGRRSKCVCSRLKGNYACVWTKSLADKICVPAPRWYRKFRREYLKAKSVGKNLRDLEIEYYKVDSLAVENSKRIDLVEIQSATNMSHQ